MPSLNIALIAALCLPLTKLAEAQLFTVSCQPLTVHRGDPIVSPGEISAHVHAVVGGTGFQLAMGEDTAVNAGDTTCDKKVDKSNYWQPQLYHQNQDGMFEMAPFDGSALYYLNRACDHEPGKVHCPPDFESKPVPAGLRMVTGDPMRRTFDESSFEHIAIRHVCLNDDGSPGDSYTLPTKSCQRMRAETYFPSCWDGENLDSSDHKSHMAYPQTGSYDTGMCPESHPFAIFSVFMEFFYDTSIFNNRFNKWVYAMGDLTGYGLHGDFINGWEQRALDNAMETCTGPNGFFDPNCSVNENAGSAEAKDPEVAPPSEEVGFNGPLSKLPGDNPVTTSSRSMRSRIARNVYL